MAAWDASPIVNVARRPPPPDLMLQAGFREGFSRLAPNGLSFDSWCYHPQLPQLIELVDLFPATRVVVNHCGGPLQAGPYASRRPEAFRDWAALMKELGRRPNVFVKIGGLNMRILGFDHMERDRPPTSDELAVAWKATVETCIEAFGVERSMFESNFPPDKGSCSARVLWNAFKRIAHPFSEAEKHELFAGTAIRAYGLSSAFGEG
jgi:predicted TIM-barrel fold metal-dependent hydrolase